MNQCGYFAKNLEAIRKINNANLTEFSEELDIPKSTLQDILKDGNTSLHTALHIAEHLNIPLSTLTGGMVPVDKPDVLTILLRYFAWFDRLSKEEQKTVAAHFRSIMEVVQK